jgi:hypothetical protein
MMNPPGRGEEAMVHSRAKAGRSNEPTGPFWNAACLECNWLVFKLALRENGKLDKLPSAPNGSAPIAVHDAAGLTYAVAKTRVAELGRAYGIGYLARSGSALIGIDLDRVVQEGVIQIWAEDLLEMTSSYAEYSPSGTGIRIILARGDSPELMHERPSLQMGYYGSGARFFSFTGRPLPERASEIVPAPELVSDVLGSLTADLAPQAKPGNGHDDAHWFERLSEQRQDEEVERMLDCLTDPKFGDYDLWLKLSFAAYHATDSMGFGIWDRWCRKLPGYDASENADKWSTFHSDRPDKATVGTLVWYARECGYQPPQDVLDSTAALALSAERLAEINARLQADREQRAAKQSSQFETSEAAIPDREHPPGLLGALVDHGELRCPFKSRLPALAGAIVGFATASANRFAVHLGGDNLMSVGNFLGVIGETGSGKETALSYSGLIAAAGGVQPHAFASDVALHQALAAERKDGADPRVQLVTMDEWGRALQQIKGDRAGHQRALMTKLMELRGLAIGGILPARHYAKAKDDLPAVPHPFINAIFATTPRTLHDALTSADVVDGSLNRIPIIYLEATAAQRPLDEIVTGPLPDDLARLVARARRPLVVESDAPAGAYLSKTRMVDIEGERRKVGEQTFILIAASPEALEALEAFRATALQRSRAGDDFGSLWRRAFENATKLAGVCALGEAIGTDPEADPGKPVITRSTAAWAIALIERAVNETIGDLEDHLFEHEAERIQKLILRAAMNLRDKAAAETDPVVEHTAPPDKQDEMRDLKRAGWFPKRHLTRIISGQGRSSRDVNQEIATLIEGEALSLYVVTWTTSTGNREKREFMTCIPGR